MKVIVIISIGEAMKSTILIVALLFFCSDIQAASSISDSKENPRRSDVTNTKAVLLKSGRDFIVRSNGELAHLPDGEAFEHFTDFYRGFCGSDFSLRVDNTPLLHLVRKTTIVDEDQNTVQNTFDLGSVVVQTMYGSFDGNDPRASRKIKQVTTIYNRTSKDMTIAFRTRTKLSVSNVTWDGMEYSLGRKPEIFTATKKKVSIQDYAKQVGKGNLEGLGNFKNYIHTYLSGNKISFESEGLYGSYDWADVSNLDHEVHAYKTNDGSYIELGIRDLKVPAEGEVVIDPVYSLDDPSSYDVRYDGYTDIWELAQEGSIATGDVNGDGIPDLAVGSSSGSAFVIFGGTGIGTGEKPLDMPANYNIRYDYIADPAPSPTVGSTSNPIFPAIGDLNGDGLGDLVLSENVASNNGMRSGSAWVIFSTVIDDVGNTTGNIKQLSDQSTYNIRFDGEPGEYLTIDNALTIGDVNGDGSKDLILGSRSTSHNGISSGSAWVIFSTLMDDAGNTTGNIKQLSLPGNYNIRYDGAPDDSLTENGSIVIGDVNGDGLSDLVLSSWQAGNNGPYSGSVWVLFSTVLDDFGESTGNIQTLDQPDSFNIRYDGGPGDSLTFGYEPYGTILATGDLNGDGLGDIVMGSAGARYGGYDGGSVWVVFSTLIDDIGESTGNTRILNQPENLNVRYDGAFSDHIASHGALDIGDVNRDGLGDLVFGSMSSDYGGLNSGSVWVVFSTLMDDLGNTTGNIRSVVQPECFNIRYDGGEEDRLTSPGTLVIGDVNGDGFGDLILGSIFATDGDVGYSNSGRVWVVLSTLMEDVGDTTGNEKPLSQETNFSMRFDAGPNDYYLTDSGSVAISDINGDDLDDLLLGSWRSGNRGRASGSVWIMYSTLLDVGSTTGHIMPLSEATSYDIRFDGATILQSLGSYGAIVIGDVNGDNQPDLVVGDSNAGYGGVYSGSAFVVFGGADIGIGELSLDIASNYNIRYDGDVRDGLTMWNSISIGDVNGDGLGDLVLGGPGAGNGGDHSGSVWIIFSTLVDDVGGTTGNVKPLGVESNYNVRYDGPGGDSLPGYGSMAIGDVNGDGHGDLVLGACYADEYEWASGSAWVVFSTLTSLVGQTTGNVRPLSQPNSYNIRFDGATVDNELTYKGALAIGDVNGDGLGDLLLGAHDGEDSLSNTGSAWVAFSTLIDDVGSTTGNIWQLSQPESYNIRYVGDPGEHLTGWGPIAVGDVNGDGLGDLMLVSSRADNNGDTSGSVWVMFSTLIDDVSESTGNILALSQPESYSVRYDGEAGDCLVCEDELAIGDVNGDGLGDLVLGAHNNGVLEGSIWIIFSTLMEELGTTNGNIKRLSQPENFNVRYDGSYVGYGNSQAALSIGDINKDGLEDLIIGQTGAYSIQGNIWVLFSTHIDDAGGTTGNIRKLSQPTGYNIRYEGTLNDYLTAKNSVAIGDVSGDGYGDLAFGSFTANYNGLQSGSVWIVFGADICSDKPERSDCGACMSCDASGNCVEDLTKHGDCPLCQECQSGWTCVNQAEGFDIKDECADDSCATGFCDVAGACGLLPVTTECRSVTGACDVPEYCDGVNPACPEDVYVEAGISCSDGDVCNGEETCDGLGLCQAGEPLECDNHLYCDGIETCDPVFGCLSGTEPCDDGVDCTVDVCDESTDSCTRAPDHTRCGDGEFCNGVEICDLAGCLPGGDPCNDTIDCTVDICDESSDSCTYISYDAFCDDGFFCSGKENCDDILGCLPGTDPCNDGIDCTDDICSEDTGSCTNMPIDAFCSDDKFCNGTESCVDSFGCMPGTNPCDDRVECTVDICDEDTDSCRNEPINQVCDDGIFCNGSEVCDPMQGCLSGSDPCNDGDICTEDACDEGRKVCRHIVDWNCRGHVAGGGCGCGFETSIDDVASLIFVIGIVFRFRKYWTHSATT